MLRMNRAKQGKSNDVKNECANYNTGYICSGVIINSRLHQFIDAKLENKKCLIKEGKECLYFENFVKVG